MSSYVITCAITFSPSHDLLILTIILAVIHPLSLFHSNIQDLSDYQGILISKVSWYIL